MQEGSKSVCSTDYATPQFVHCKSNSPESINFNDMIIKKQNSM